MGGEFDVYLQPRVELLLRKPHLLQDDDVHNFSSSLITALAPDLSLSVPKI